MGSPDQSPHETTHSVNRKGSKDSNVELGSERHQIGTGNLDDFGLPRKTPARRPSTPQPEQSTTEDEKFEDAEDGSKVSTADHADEKTTSKQMDSDVLSAINHSSSQSLTAAQHSDTDHGATRDEAVAKGPIDSLRDEKHDAENDAAIHHTVDVAKQEDTELNGDADHGAPLQPIISSKTHTHQSKENAVSEWSHQRMAPRQEDSEEEDEEQWQTMPAVAEYDLYDDDGRLIARGIEEEDAEQAVYGGLGGAGKGYTRVQIDDDAQSATSMDDDTRYLFKAENQRHHLVDEEEQRDAVSQLEATKDLLTEGQRIAYVGVTRLTIYQMTTEVENAKMTKSTKKDFSRVLESLNKWGQQMMVRLYQHMDIDSAEQVMIEQLAEHGVQPSDLVPPLMQSPRVHNPMAEIQSPRFSVSSASTSVRGKSSTDVSRPSAGEGSARTDDDSENEDGGGVPEVHTPSQMTHDAKIDLDLRWTVLCDLFLVLIADSAYDARSRSLLERIGAAMDVSWVQICRFEKRVIDALEMEEEKDKETWNEDDHLEARRKKGLKHKYVMMGLATVGGGLVIGLSAGLLAPVIGAGLAAGFTTIGVTGTAGFLGGVGGAALITSAATAAGGTIAVRASSRRTGHVKTFEYRPLHNNKRLNLIITVSGWMSGKVDDVRLPYSTVDPIMGDIYSLLWEPEMLTSMGDTINILATEALTQTVQQVLGSTILVALMASLQLPIVLTKLSYLIDNPWSVSLDRATAAGLILADSLIDRHLGNRPVTLVGFSLGSRLIFSCLKELANRGAYGLVQNVYLFGSPIVAKRDEYLRARTAVSGRFVNGYASNDWILGYLFRATTGGIMRVAGLAPVEDVVGLENIDVSGMVNGHMAYRTAMPRLLREVGWEVESDEFSEIEDPDPENHAQRQRELIKEIDEARRQAEEKPEKKRFGLFKKGKLAQKKGWETYDRDGAMDFSDMKAGSTEPTVLFDIEAIKRELESEMIEVKQLESTLPPMKLDISPSVSGISSPRDMLRQTKSSEANLPTQDTTLPVYSETSMSLRTKNDEAFTAPPRSFTDSAMEHPRSEEEDITSSFEPAFESPKELRSTLPPLSIDSSLSYESLSTVRPELRSVATMPVNTSAYSTFGNGMEHNAWADEDDEFGKEKEITMTFE